MTTTGRVHNGCRLEEEFFNLFTKDGKITLVLEKNHADFQVAQDIVETINSQMRFQVSGTTPLAHALNQGNIEVIIPRQYSDDPVSFVSQVLALQVMEPRTGARVVVNERPGSVIISGDVEIGAVAITHKNIVIGTAGSPSTGSTGSPIRSARYGRSQRPEAQGAGRGAQCNPRADERHYRDYQRPQSRRQAPRTTGDRMSIQAVSSSSAWT